MDSSLSGTVVHIRKISKKILFFDIENQDLAENPCSTDHSSIHMTSTPLKRTTVVLKSWECGESIVLATRSKSKIHVGDEVSFKGYFENEDTFSAKTYNIDQLWSLKSPGAVFLPKPPADTPTKSVKRSSSNDLDLEQSCKYFLNTGKCSKSSCKYSHLEDKKVLTEKRVEFIKNKKEKRILVHEGDFVCDIASSSQRARVYAEWIVEKFGFEFLKTGMILDIGGGRGDLSFELVAKLGLDCIVVDPRPQKFKRWQLKFIKKHPSCKLTKHIQDLFNKDFFDIHKVDLKSIRLVVGLHPDEATEPLVDMAVDFFLNFAVIPCCVFSQDFPLRKLKNGKSPTSYEDFCDFLVEKSSGVENDLLPFVGKNKVLFKKQF
eukprot:GFUD01016886.1.p1 GENE.GFUD01016886.1~~GFUD01016886.1.p1  ORF type:complete len:376 (+),score=90.30 GFUD01016886.1:46-1173(+)